MAFFRRAEDGKIYFEQGKYKGWEINVVALADPKYLRWAWKDCTATLPLDVYEDIEQVMKTNGVSFTKPRKR